MKYPDEKFRFFFEAGFKAGYVVGQTKDIIENEALPAEKIINIMEEGITTLRKLISTGLMDKMMERINDEDAVKDRFH